MIVKNASLWQKMRQQKDLSENSFGYTHMSFEKASDSERESVFIRKIRTTHEEVKTLINSGFLKMKQKVTQFFVDKISALQKEL